MLTRKLLSVIDTIIVDVFKIICCSEPTDSFIPSQRHCSSTARAQPGHKVLQPEPALEPPAPPGRGGPHDPQGPHVTAGQSKSHNDTVVTCL